MQENRPSNNHHWKSIRLAGYDYGQAGGYFITIATHHHAHLLGEIRGGEMRLSPCGKIVKEMLLCLPGRFPGVILDEYVLMPDHVHMILI